MKQVLLFLSVVTFILFTSCEKENEPIPDEPILLTDLAIDLQNGYWETDFGTAISVLKFNTSTANSYWIEGNPLCIITTTTQDYTLEGNLLTLVGNGTGPLTIEIQGNSLLMEVDGHSRTYERKSTLDYTDC